MTRWTNRPSKLILGGPGAGKTQRMMEILQDELESGVSEDEIAFVSYTKAAVEEAKRRAARQLGLSTRRFRHCKTIHALCFAAINAKSGQTVGPRHLEELAGILGCSYTVDDSDYPGTLNIALKLYERARSTGVDVEVCWRDEDADITVEWLHYIIREYETFKAAHCLLDFADMLGRYLEEGSPLHVKVAIVDEAQDLSHVQWRVIEKAFSEVERIYFAGDDAQCIHVWSGSDVQSFLSLEVRDTEIIPQTHRLQPKIHAFSQKLISRVSARYEKDFDCANQGDAGVYYHGMTSTVDLTEPGTWLLLCRCNRQLRTWERFVEEMGLPYRSKWHDGVRAKDREAIRLWEAMRRGEPMTGGQANLLLAMCGITAEYDKKETVSELPLPDAPWYDVIKTIPRGRKDYYRRVLQQGEAFLDEPRIRISTIHGAKGAEADNVAVLNSTSRRIHEAMSQNADDEYRVWYVAVTRSRGPLHIVAGRSRYYFPF